MTNRFDSSSGPSSSVETLEERLRQLLREREQLHSRGAEADTLERNRLAIVDAQWELSRSLIARHRPGFQAA